MNKKITLIKSLTLFIALFGVVNFGFGQNCNFYDDFNRSDNTNVGNSWLEYGDGDASINSNELVLDNNSTAGRNYVVQNVSSFYNTTLNALVSPIEWTFNMQQIRTDPSGFITGRYGVAFVLAGKNLNFNNDYGYAVVLGQTGTTDNVRLVSYNGGLDLDSNLTTIVSGTTDYGNEHLSIKVIYTPTTDTWELFVRNDGAAFADPSTLNASNLIGSALNSSAWTTTNLNFVGMYWNHSFGADQTATFDNVCIYTSPCATTTTWTAGAWDNGTPTTSTNVIIDDVYDTATPGNGSFSACTLQVNAAGNLIVNNGDFVEVENNVVVDGTIYVDTQGNFVQNDSGATFTLNVGGTASVHKVTATKNDWFYYTYWSSPVEDETVDGAFPNTDTDRRFRYEAANYIDRGDGIDDNGNDWQLVAGGDNLVPGVGYAATSSPFGFYPGTDIADFNGAFNTGDISTAIFNNPVNANSWNFIGNPYPGAIDFDAFQSANSAVIDGAAYFWSQASDPNAGNPGNQNSNFSTNDYATYTVGSGGSAGASGITPTQYVPSAQGFFIAGLANGNATFTNSMRSIVANSNDQFFKNSNSKDKTTSAANRLWINLASDNGVFGQILIAYVDGASNSDDGLYYDAPKLSPNGTFAILYTEMDNSNKKFVIQGKSPNSLTEDEVIKLGFNTSIDVPTIYTLSIAQFQGDFLTDNPIYLKDNLLNKVHCLSTSDYTFTSDVGEFKDRFEILFSGEALSNTAFDADPNTLVISQVDESHVSFKASNNASIKTVRIFDLLGRQLYQLSGSHNEETYNLTHLNHVVFIAKVELSNGAILTKKAILK